MLWTEEHQLKDYVVNVVKIEFDYFHVCLTSKQKLNNYA